MSDMRTVNVAVWTALTTLGLAGGLVTGLLVGMTLSQIANAMVVTAAVTCCAGAVLGGFQAFGLRGVLRAPWWWIVATMAGTGAGLAIGVVIVEQIGILVTGQRPNIGRLGPDMRALSLFVVGATTGAFLGVAQSVVLRRRVQHWIRMTTLALGSAFAISAAIVDLLRLRFASPSGALTFVLLAGLAFGLLTSRRVKAIAV